MNRSSRDCQPQHRNMRAYDNKKTYFPYSEANSKFKTSLLSEISTDDSQNIVLRLSDSAQDDVSSFHYYKEQAQERLRVSKVIVISDSSESSSPEKADRRCYQYNYLDKNSLRSDNIMIEESSSSDESNSDNERIQSSDGNDKCVDENLLKIPRKIVASSDETICTINSDKSSNNSDASHVSPTPCSPRRRDLGDIFSKFSETKSKYFVDEPISNITHRKYTNYKSIRPKRPFYFTDIKKATESTDSRADTKGSGSSEDHEETNDRKTVDVSEENETDTTHITGTLPELEKSNEEPEIIPVTLSERKKKEIAKWILTNSPESRSSSSCSNISESRKNISSGNSSLERFELKYETPNNRGKIKQGNGDKLNNDQKSKNQQTTLNRFIKKVAPLDFTTPNQDKVLSPKTLSTKSTYNTGTENLGLLDCADVLDNLYGSDWRKNADVLLQSSEPRKPLIPRIDRAVQTEKKKIPKSKYQTILRTDTESEDENFDIIIRNTKPRKEKSKKKSTEQNDSFIDDRNSSDISGDSIYHTAVTNQRHSSDGPLKKAASVPQNVQQILNEICDPDSEEEEDAKKITKNKVINRRRLLYTDDDTEGSSTSEFDPEDQILPKPIPKKDFLKMPFHAPKTTSKTKTLNFEPRGVKSFLASLSVNVSMSETHADAKIYKLNFKNTKEELSRKLFRLYNENIFDNKLPDNLPIEWSVRMTGTAGFCFNKRSIKNTVGVVRSSRIQLATKIIDTPERLRDTLVHEMCHAAAWLINDVSDGHGPYWKSWANKAMRTFPELPEIKRCHDYKINTKYTYRCTGCGYSIGRHSKSLDTEKRRCGHCYGKFEVLINKTTKSGTLQTKTPSRSKEPSGFALYVKENYHSIKQNRRSMKHGEVMKILGQQFSAIKIAKKHDNVEQNNIVSSDL